MPYMPAVLLPHHSLSPSMPGKWQRIDWVGHPVRHLNLPLVSLVAGVCYKQALFIITIIMRQMAKNRLNRVGHNPVRHLNLPLVLLVLPVLVPVLVLKVLVVAGACYKQALLNECSSSPSVQGKWQRIDWVGHPVRHFMIKETCSAPGAKAKFIIIILSPLSSSLLYYHIVTICLNFELSLSYCPNLLKIVIILSQSF